jgi:chromosome segregation ATPase
MRSLSVVTKSGVLSDETETIELIDTADVKALIQKSLGPIRKDVAEQDGKIASIRNQISVLQREISAHKENIDALGKNISKTSKQICDLSVDLNLKIDTHKTAMSELIEALKKTLCSDFMKKCSDDVQGYFRQLIEYAEKISQDAVLMQNIQKSMEEQYNATSVIAKFFCDYYRSELKRREELLQQDSERLAVFNSFLPPLLSDKTSSHKFSE